MSKIYTDGWHLVKGRNDAILVKDGKFSAAIIRGVHCAPYAVDKSTGKYIPYAPTAYYGDVYTTTWATVKDIDLCAYIRKLPWKIRDRIIPNCKTCQRYVHTCAGIYGYITDEIAEVCEGR